MAHDIHGRHLRDGGWVGRGGGFMLRGFFFFFCGFVREEKTVFAFWHVWTGEDGKGVVGLLCFCWLLSLFSSRVHCMIGSGLKRNGCKAGGKGHEETTRHDTTPSSTDMSGKSDRSACPVQKGVVPILGVLLW